MHKNKDVGERYGDASISYGGVDLSNLAWPGLEDAVRKDKEITWCDSRPLIGQSCRVLG